MNPQNKTISVQIITHNRADLLPRAILSVFAQSYENWEVVIVDDSSTDSTKEVLSQYSSGPRGQKVSVIKNPEKIGITKSRNIALKASSGRYLAVLDSDDEWYPTKLEEQIGFLANNPDISVLGTDIEIIDATGKKMKEKKYPHTDQEIRSVMLRINPFCHSSIIFDRDRDLHHNSVSIHYDENLDRWEDYELYLRLGSDARIKFANLSQTLTKYRVHGTNITRTKVLHGALLHLKLSLKYLHNYPNKAVSLLINLARLSFSLLKSLLGR